MFQVALLLDLHAVVLLVPVVWTFLMENTASVIESVCTPIAIPVTTAALTIPVKVTQKWLMLRCYFQYQLNCQIFLINEIMSR